MPTIVDGPYEWDSAKDRANLQKHGVSFAEGSTALADQNAKVLPDPGDEQRFLAIGFSLTGALLAVVYEPRGQRERIISARKVTREERKRYMRPEALTMTHAAKTTKSHDEPSMVDVSRAPLVRRGPGRTVRLSLRTLREAARLTQAQVEKRSGLSQPVISNLETASALDDRMVSTVRRYLEAIGCDLDLVSVSRYGHRIGVAGAHTVEDAPILPAKSAPDRIAAAAAVLRDRLGAATQAARDFAEATRAIPEPEGWKGAKQDTADLAIVVELVLGLAKAVTMNRARPRVVEVVNERTIDWLGSERDTLHAIMATVVPILRPDRRRAKPGGRGMHAPVRRDDLARDLSQCSLAAIRRSPWSKGEPEHIGTIDKEMKDVQPAARFAWLVKKGWTHGGLEALVNTVARMLTNHGHLLGRKGPDDLRKRLEQEIKAQREKAKEKPSAGNPENFVEAVFRAYGLDAKKTKSQARLRSP